MSVAAAPRHTAPRGYYTTVLLCCRKPHTDSGLCEEHEFQCNNTECIRQVSATFRARVRRHV